MNTPCLPLPLSIENQAIPAYYQISGLSGKAGAIVGAKHLEECDQGLFRDVRRSEDQVVKSVLTPDASEVMPER